MGGIKQFLNHKNKEQNPDGTEKGEETYHFDIFGNRHKYTKNNQGEPEAATNDSDTKKSKSIMDKFMNSINSIPGIGAAIGGLGGLLGGLKDKLIGNEKEPGLLSKLFDGLFSDDGFLSGLFTLFTGKGTNKLLSGVTLKSVLTKIAAPALLAGGFAGVFDNAIKAATGGAYGKKDNDEAFDSTTGQKVTKLADGTYVDTNGNIVDPANVEIKKTDVSSFSDKLKENTVRGIFTNKSSIASKVIGKRSFGKSISSLASKAANVVKTSGDDIARAAASAATLDFQLTITDGIKKFTKLLKKVKILAPVADKLDNLGAELAEKACKALASGGMKKIANLAANLVVWAKVAFVVIDFSTGYQDARTTLGITAEPTVPQRIVSGLVRSIKNFIPVIGSLIPDSTIIDLFCKYVAPAFGINVDELMKQREDAQAEVDEYNAINGTNYTIGEYNKAVLNDYTWTEKIGNSVKTGWNKIKDKWNSDVKSVKEKGFWGATKDNFKEKFSGSGSGFVSQYDPRYQGYQVSGQNFAAKGCGPAVAAMAARSLGKNVSVGDAVNRSIGYQNGNGVTIDYFQNMLGSKGINTRYISGGSSAELYNSIAHGDKVVLLGRDPYNTSKENSPFGPNNHYVLATGLDRRGNVIINDPENRGPKSYSPSILNSAKFGVAGSNSGIRRLPRSSRFIGRFSGGSGYDTDIAKQVWAFFTGLGYSPECTAGIMGNLYAESGMNPAVIQGGGKGPAAGICQWENYNTKSGRWKAMADYAASRGKDWTDLDSQLNFIHKELTSNDIDQRMSAKIGASNWSNVGYSTSNAMSYSQWKTCKDIQKATYLFEIAFERAGSPHMERRLQAAAAYYNLYSGKTYTYTGTVDTSSYTPTTSTGTTSSASENSGLFGNIWNVVSDIGTVFSNSFGKVFNKNANSDNQEKQVYGNNSTGSNKALISTGTAPSGDTANNFPYFGQAEDPWAKESYGQGTIKSSGCGPTSMAMVAKSYGINTDPNRMADWSVDNGHRIPNQGTSWAFFPAVSKELGLNADQFSDAAKAKEYLNQGIPVIGSMKPGDFTKGGHYIVFSGLKGNRIFVNDPASRKRTGNVWDVDSTFSQAKQFWAISNKDGTGSIDNSKLSAAGSGLVCYQDLANMAGGSSGILMKARPGSINNIPVRMSNGRLVPVSNFTGGASDIMTTQTQSMLSNLTKNATKSSGISPELVSKLITSITQILERIANNTAPVSQIYQALVAYIQSGGNSGISEKPVPIKVNKSQNNQQPEPEIDSNIATLVGVLAELAKG